MLFLFCDMDGVLVDFLSAVLDIRSDWLKLPPSIKWRPVKAIGQRFWAELNWTDDGKTLWAYIKKKHPNVMFLTAIPRMREARHGKMSWVERNLGAKYATRVLTCFRRDKNKYAGPGRVLIDDREDNIRDWEAAGGIGIHHTDALSTIWKLEELFDASSL